MILKSFLIEKNVSQLDQYDLNLIYGENLGLKDDIKTAIKIHLEGYEQISFNQDEIIKNKNLLSEQIDNVSLFSKKKVIFLNEISDKIRDHLGEFLEKPNTDVKHKKNNYNLQQTLPKVHKHSTYNNRKTLKTKTNN